MSLVVPCTGTMIDGSPCPRDGRTCMWHGPQKPLGNLDAARVDAELRRRERQSILDMWMQGKATEAIGALIDWISVVEIATMPRVDLSRLDANLARIAESEQTASTTVEVPCNDRGCPGYGLGCRVRVDAPTTLIITGAWHVYFHRLNPDSLPWCIAPDAGGWEIVVRSVEFEVPARAVYEPKATPDDEDGRPSAWIAVTGTLTVSADGRATIRGSERST